MASRSPDGGRVSLNGGKDGALTSMKEQKKSRLQNLMRIRKDSLVPDRMKKQGDLTEEARGGKLF